MINCVWDFFVSFTEQVVLREAYPWVLDKMKLECPVCFNLLSEKPDLKFKPEPDPDNSRPRVKKRRCGDEDETDSPSTDQLQEKAQLVVTKCGHLFHKCCLESWFATNLSCPTCRKPAPDGVEEFRNVFLPTPNDDDSQILFRNATGELEVTKIHLEALGEENESLKEENELLKKKIEELTNATRVKDRSSIKLQNYNDLMETCTNKLRDRHLRRM